MGEIGSCLYHWSSVWKDDEIRGPTAIARVGFDLLRLFGESSSWMDLWLFFFFLAQKVSGGEQELRTIVFEAIQ